MARKLGEVVQEGVCYPHAEVNYIPVRGLLAPFYLPCCTRVGTQVDTSVSRGLEPITHILEVESVKYKLVSDTIKVHCPVVGEYASQKIVCETEPVY